MFFVTDASNVSMTNSHFTNNIAIVIQSSVFAQTNPEPCLGLDLLAYGMHIQSNGGVAKIWESSQFVVTNSSFVKNIAHV